MEVLIFLAIAVIFFIVLNIQSNQRNNADNLKKDLSVLNKQLQDLKSQLFNLQHNAPVITTTELQQKEKETAELKALEEYKQKIAAA